MFDIPSIRERHNHLIDSKILIHDVHMDTEKLAKLYERLREIAHEENITIVTQPFKPGDLDTLIDYCRKDIEAGLHFRDCLHHIQRSQRRRKLRHVSRGQRNMEPQRRKAYRGKRGVPTKEAVQLLEPKELRYHFVKSRKGPDGLEIRFDPSFGHPERPIQAIHERQPVL